MNCNYVPKFLHFCILGDIGSLIFSSCVVLWLCLNMDVKPPDEVELYIVKNIMNQYFRLKILALVLSVYQLVTFALVLTYDLIVILPPSSSSSLMKFKDILRKELVE